MLALVLALLLEAPQPVRATRQCCAVLVAGGPFHDPSHGDFFRTGTGVIVSPTLILTAYHIVVDAQTIKWKTQSGQLGLAKLFMASTKDDLALVSVEPMKFSFWALLEEHDPAETEDIWVVATLPDMDLAMLEGHVVRMGQPFSDEPTPMLIVDVWGAPGTSGGPILNKLGKVLGIVSELWTRDDGRLRPTPLAHRTRSIKDIKWAVK